MSEPADDRERALKAQREIDQICDEFETAWKSGQSPDMDEFLARCDGDNQDALAYELILLDSEYYRASSGQARDKQFYVERFPHLTAAIERAFPGETDKFSTVIKQSLELETVAPSAHQNSPSLVGQRLQYFGDYELLDEIARGGMGVVYRAKQISLNRIIALKMILSGQIAGDDEVRRFQREAEAAANLDHPGIVPIYDIGEHNGQHYFSMKLIEGQTLSGLSDTLKSDHPRTIQLVAAVADAIHHAHQRGILHRDLKPANILLDANNNPLVTDFGLARNVTSDQQLTQTGAVVGTPGFMPPEQAAGKSVTTAADIYSLGAILFHLLCGRPPHVGDSVMGTLMSVINDPPPKPRELNPAIHPDLELICLKCLAKNPADRYSSAAEFAADLRAFAAGEPLRVRAPSVIEITRMWLSSNYGNVIWVPIIAAVIGAIAGFSLWVSTMGENVSSFRETYDNFPASDRPLMMINWLPFQFPALFLFLLMLTMIGWATAKLVRTRNRAADIGAGISVGLLAGLMAFSAGMGSLLVEGMMYSVEQDSELLFQLAATSNSESSYAQQRIATQYPSLERLTPVDRTVNLYRKSWGDRYTGSLAGIAFGTIICLAWFGSLGLIETWVAGPLTREQPGWKGLLSYLCFTLAMVAAFIIVASDLTLRFMVGSGLILDWLIPVGCIASALLGMSTVVLRWPRLVQLGITVVWMFLFWQFLTHNLMGGGGQETAVARTEIKTATSLLASDANRREYKMRLTRAYLEYGILDAGLDRSKQAYDAYADALKAMDSIGPYTEFNNEESILHAHILSVASFTAIKLGHLEQAATWLALHTQQYASSPIVYSTYAETVLSLDRPTIDFLAPTAAVNQLDAWYRVASQLRALASFRESQSTSDATITDAWLTDLVEQVLDRTTSIEQATDWPAQRKELKQWLTGRQTWELFGPFKTETGQDVKQVLDSVYGPEVNLLGSDDKTPASMTVSKYVGSIINLTKELSNEANSVAYARTEIYLDDEQQIRFRLGSDDGIKVWIDGNLLYSNPVYREIFEGNDIVDLSPKLPAGKHTVLIKICETTGGWGFVFNTSKLDDWPLLLAKQTSSNESEKPPNIDDSPQGPSDGP